MHVVTYSSGGFSSFQKINPVVPGCSFAYANGTSTLSQIAIDAATVVLVGCIFLAWKNSVEEQHGTRAANTSNGDNISNPSSPPNHCFPWEVNISSGKRNENSGESKDQQLQELQFLASMTFANGGIRAPSCPCCR